MSMYYPGNNSNKSRRLLYNAQYNYIRNMLNVNSQENAFYYPALQQQHELECNCQIADSLNITSTSTHSNESKNMKISKLLQRKAIHGKIQYASGSNLGNGFYLNYLGRTPGQQGGSGKAPKNRLV